MKNYYATLLITAIITASAISCADNSSSATDGMPIAIHPKVSTRVTDTSFENGDCIGVDIYFSENSSYITNAKMVHNGTSFLADDVKWYDADKSATFGAQYPYDDAHPNTTLFRKTRPATVMFSRTCYWPTRQM